MLFPLFFLLCWVEAGGGGNVGRYKGLLSLRAQEGIWKSGSGSISPIVLGTLLSRPRRFHKAGTGIWKSFFASDSVGNSLSLTHPLHTLTNLPFLYFV